MTYRAVSTIGAIMRFLLTLVLAIALLFFRARDLPPSPARSAIATAFVVGRVLLAATGHFEVIIGRAGIGMLSAVATELTIAAALWSVRDTA